MKSDSQTALKNQNLLKTYKGWVWHGHMQAMTSATMGIDCINHEHSLSPHATLQIGSSSRLLGLSPPGRTSRFNSNIIKYITCLKIKRIFMIWSAAFASQQARRTPFPSQKTCNLPNSTNPKQPQSGVLDARDHTYQLKNAHPGEKDLRMLNLMFGICFNFLCTLFLQYHFYWCRNINFTTPNMEHFGIWSFFIHVKYPSQTLAADGLCVFFFQRRLWMFHDICYNVWLGEWEMWQNLIDIH